MQTQIQQIIQYTEQQITTFQRAECPTITQTFRQIADVLRQFETLTNKHPLTPQTINAYNNAIQDLEIACKKLSFYGPDFSSRLNMYKRFKSNVDMEITQTIHKSKQSSR